MLVCLALYGCGGGTGATPDSTGGNTDAAAGTGGAQSSGGAGVTSSGGAPGNPGTGGTGTGGAGTGGSGTGGGTGTAGTGGSAGQSATGGNASTGGAGATAGGGGGGATAAGGAGGSAGSSGGTGSIGLQAAGVRWFGRADISDPTQPRFSWSGTGFAARFSGTGLTARLDNTASFIFKVLVDGVAKATFTSTTGAANYDLVTGLATGTHSVELYRQTESGQGNSRLLSLTVAGGSLSMPPPASGRLIEVVGDSISAGYGALGTLADSDCFPTEDHWSSYESVAARAVNAEVSTIAASGHGMVRNYGGDMVDTLPMIYPRALMNVTTPAWGFQIQPQAVIINLGTNDISNGKGDPGVPFRDAYRAFVETVRMKYPNAWIICMIGPMLSGTELSTIQGHIQMVVQTRKSAGDTKIEYFGAVMPQASDKYACQYHPNVAEHQIVGNQLAAELRARLGW